ncbi:Cullin-domain-containing protein, partial [Hortaea werneckii]
SEKHSGRKLTWQSNMGDADIKATFPRSKGGKPRTHDINCSTYAMLILVLFNDLAEGESLSVEEIQARTNIPWNDLKRNLQSLAVAPKTRFLVKEPMSREINPGDKFSYNENFKSEFIKIKVGVVSAGNKVEGDKERKETEKKNNDSRGFAVEAAIVRIMKQRKELAHAHLLTETINQLTAQFKPDINMIKKKIESLIEREYLERMDEEAAAMPGYRYLA